MRRFILFLLFLFWPLIAWGVNAPDEVSFTGSLLAYSAICIDPDDAFLQATFLAGRTNGLYNQENDFLPQSNLHSYPLYVNIQKGVVKNVDLQITVQGVVNHNSQGSKFLFGDMLLLLGFQIFEDFQGYNFRALLGEIFPTGKYDNLNPRLEGIDASGSGSFETTAIFALDRTFFLQSSHPLEINGNLIFIFPVPVHIKNKSIYRGDEGTRGTVIVGRSIIFNLAFEWSITRRWALCMDANCITQNASIFYPSPNNLAPFAGTPESYVVSITPGIEYIKSEHFGILGGVWLTIKGKNAASFVTPYISLYSYF